jgi:prepilin-type N-terminal cleavage/methylation domain-containing protein
MKKERGFTALEMVATAGIIAVGAAMATPSIIKANRAYQLNSAAQQVAQTFQAAKFEALRNNSTQTVLIDPTARTITISNRTITLPTGITFETQQSSTDVPDVIKNAVENGITGQQTNEKASVSFPMRSSDNKYEATFNSRGMPNVQPGAVNWLYLVNADGEKMAVTLTSAGSTNLWRKTGSNNWKDTAGKDGGGPSQ